MKRIIVTLCIIAIVTVVLMAFNQNEPNVTPGYEVDTAYVPGREMKTRRIAHGNNIDLCANIIFEQENGEDITVIVYTAIDNTIIMFGILPFVKNSDRPTKLLTLAELAEYYKKINEFYNFGIDLSGDDEQVVFNFRTYTFKFKNGSTLSVQQIMTPGKNGDFFYSSRLLVVSKDFVKYMK